MSETTFTTAHAVRDVLIIFFALLAIVLTTFFTVNTYKDNVTNATTILAAVIPAMAAIGAAAFGIAYAAKASAEASQAREAKANAEGITKETKKDTQLLATYVAPLKSQIENISSSVQLLPSPAGNLSFLIPETDDDIRALQQSLREKREIKPINMQTLDSAKEQIAKIEVLLERINSR